MIYSEPTKFLKITDFLWVHFKAIAACVLENLSILQFFGSLFVKEL